MPEVRPLVITADVMGQDEAKRKDVDQARPQKPGKSQQPAGKPLHDKSSDEQYPQPPPTGDEPPPSSEPSERESDNEVIAPDGTPAPERKPEPLF